MSHIWMSRVTHMNESCHTYEWVTSHIWMSHVTLMNESCHTYEWVMSHIWMSHVTHMNESCHTYEWLIHMCDMTHSYVWHLSRTAPHKKTHSYVWLSFAKEPYKRDDILQQRPIILRSLVLDATEKMHSYVWLHMCASFMNEAHIWSHTYGSYVCLVQKDSFIRVTSYVCLIYIYGMTWRPKAFWRLSSHTYRWVTHVK